MQIKMRMPLPVIVATVAMTLILLFNIIGFIAAPETPLPSLVGIIFAALLLIGLMRAHRLAWQWGRYLAPFAGLVFLLGAGRSFGVGDLAYMIIAALLLILALASFAFPILLSRASAVQYFRLVCPACAVRTSKAADFFFNRAKCQKCQRVW
jgi:hypothetical protein